MLTMEILLLNYHSLPVEHCFHPLDFILIIGEMCTPDLMSCLFHKTVKG